MKIWAVVPAAGVGARMNSAVPKQYLELQGEAVLKLSINRLLQLPEIHGLVVPVSPLELASENSFWQQLKLDTDPRISGCAGGDSRQESVLRALEHLGAEAAAEDLVLVHDAVRPCVRPAQVRALIQALQDHPQGGLLAAPLRDTLKRADDNSMVSATLDRSGLWAALTPQIFPYALLKRALQQARDGGIQVTDEASAVEALGLKPLLFPGNPDNIKITHPDDLRLAEAILMAQNQEQNL